MKTEVTKVDKLKRKLKITVEAGELSEKKNEVYSEASKQLKVPGFRPGKVPVDVLEKHHAKVLQEKLLEQVIPLYYRKALEENEISAASTPNIYDVNLTADSLTFSADLEIRPEIEISDADYKGIKIKVNPVKVEEIEIEKVLTNIKEETKKVIQKDLNDDELAKWAGYPNLSDFRDAIKAQIHVEKLQQRRQSIDGQIGQHLLKKVKVEMPKSEVEHMRQELLNREIYNLRVRGIPENDIEKYKKEIEQKLETIAQEQLKLSYIIRAIAKNESIDAKNNLGEVVLGFVLSYAQYQ